MDDVQRIVERFQRARDNLFSYVQENPELLEEMPDDARADYEAWLTELRQASIQ